MKTVTRAVKLLKMLIFLAPLTGTAQPTVEFNSTSGPSANGPSTASQVITFKNNANNPIGTTFTAFTPTTTATFAISNQQYVLATNQSSSGAGLVFGGTVNTGGKLMTANPMFAAMNSISSASTGNFSASQVLGTAGAGMSLTSNFGVELFNSALGLYNASTSTSGTYHMANLTITFSNAIDNPVLHIVGLGGTFGPGGPTSLGLTTQLTLVTTGASLSKLSGSSELNVSSTQIRNTAANPSATTGSGAASGSILVTGNNITTLTFQVYLRGDGAYATWASASQHTGDAFLIGVSALSTAIALPITLSSFTARHENSTALLNWTTAKEENSGHFAVERNAEMGSWEVIAKVQAAGNSATLRNYQYIDANPAPGINSYRIVEYDLDNAATYSAVATLSFSQNATLTLFPNPTVNRVTVITGDSSPRSVQLYSFGGGLLASIPNFASGQSIDLSRYPRGIYLLILRDGAGQSETKKIEKL